MDSQTLLQHTPRYVFDAGAVEASTELLKVYGMTTLQSIAAVPHDGMTIIQGNLRDGHQMRWELNHSAENNLTLVQATIIISGRELDPFKYRIAWGEVLHTYQTAADKGFEIATAPLWHELKMDQVAQLHEKALSQSSATLYSLLALLMSPKAYDMETVTPDEKLNRKRAKLGRPPLTSYKVIRIDMASRKKRSGSSQSDGSEGPQRAMHRVRAHLRIVEGKIIRVRAHFRGSAEHGIAVRSYVVGSQGKVGVRL